MKNLFYICLALMLLSCGSQQNEGVFPEDNDVIVERKRLRSEIISNDSILIGPMVNRKVVRSVESSGRVSLPPNGKHVVHSASEGYVKDFKFISGDAVKKGTLLFSVIHPGIVEKQRLFLETAAERELSRKEFARKQELMQSNATSAVAFDQAAAQEKILEARYQGLRKELELWGIDVDKLLVNGEFQSEVHILSPVHGIIDEVHVHPGRMISPDDPVVSIVDRRNPHLDLQVLARYAPIIETGQKVLFSIPGSQEQYTAVVKNIGPQLNPGNETLNVHVHPEAGAISKLIPGMFVTARIQMDSIAVSGLPVSAVVREGGIHYAYGLEDDLIVKEELTSVEKIGDLIVFDKLPYEEFVIKGAYYLE